MNNFLNKVILIVVVVLLEGCATLATPTTVIVPEAALLVQKVRIDPKLLLDCEPTLAELKGVLPADVLEALADSKLIHDVCYQRLHQLIAVVKTAFPQEVSNATISPSNSQPK